MTQTLYSRMKGAALGVVLLLLCAAGVALYAKNREGFSGRWNIYLEEVLKQQGINAEVGGFKYSLKDGLMTKDFKIYSLDPETPEKVCASFEKVMLDFDGKTATKGDFNAEKLTLSRGKAWVDLHDEGNNRIFINDIHCVLSFTRGYDVIIEECRAVVAGIEVTLSGESIGVRQPKEVKSALAVPEVLRGIFRHLYLTSSSEAQPPKAQIHLVHTYGKENGLEIDITFDAMAFQYKELTFEKVQSEMRYENRTLFINKFYAVDDTGELKADGKYFTQNNTGKFKLHSTTNLPKLVRSLGVDSMIDKLVSPLPPLVTAECTVTGRKNAQGKLDWTLQTHGHLKLDEFRLLGTNFLSLDTDFSWRDGMLFLRDMTVNHAEGEVAGKILIMDQYIRYEAQSNLPLYLYEPFIKEGGILARNISKTDFTDKSTIQLSMKGSMQRDQIDQWEASGQVSFTNLAYNDVPMEDASCYFIFNPLESRFSDIEASFSYSKYIPSRFAEKQPSYGIVIAEEIAYDSREGVVKIKQLGGRAWIPPIINLFIPRIGDFIDDTIHFAEPPAFSTNGVIGLKGNTHKTSLQNKILLPLDAYYTFLGKDLKFEEFDASIHLKGHSVFINDIDTYTLGGLIRGNIEVINKNPQAPAGGYNGDISFTQISLPEVADKYEFKITTPGNLTGRSSFYGLPSEISTLGGEGFISLDNADLFHVPVFGPLSPLLSGFMGNKDSTHEQVRNLSTSFIINRGRLLTNDLTTQTPSAKITGDGMIDLNTKQMDITVRTKTQGLLGLITLPIKPLEKFLQFRGTGSISKPEWKFSPGESTPKYLKERSSNENKAIIVE